MVGEENKQSQQLAISIVNMNFVWPRLDEDIKKIEEGIDVNKENK